MAALLDSPTLAAVAVLLVGALLAAVAYHTGSLAAERRQARRLRLGLAACPKCRGAMCAACDWTGLADAHRPKGAGRV